MNNIVIQNRLSSDLANCISELESGVLSKSDMLGYFSSFMESANVDSHITVNVLERFGDEGKEAALAIKVNEGW